MARKITDLHPRLQGMLDEVLYACKMDRQLSKIIFTECVRTVKEQDALYALGRTKKGNIVTKAKGSDYNSMHQWGVAVDFCRNVKGSEFKNSDKFFERVGQIAKKHGLYWGGDFESIKDLPHLQMKEWGTTPNAHLKKMYASPKDFRACWPHYKGKYETVRVASFRPCAGTSYPKIADIPKGTKLTADGVYNNSKAGNVWIRVTYKGQKGYVCIQSLKRK